MRLILIGKLFTGVEWQDKQHEELFDRINKLLYAIECQHGEEELARVLDFLDIYVKDHFSNEENAMEKYKYPDILIHKTQHEKFIKNMVHLREKFKDHKDPSLLKQAENLLADWFYDHVVRIDKNLGEFLQR